MKWFKREKFLRVEAPEVAVVTVVTKAAPRLVFGFFLFSTCKTARLSISRSVYWYI